MCWNKSFKYHMREGGRKEGGERVREHKMEEETERKKGERLILPSSTVSLALVLISPALLVAVHS